jgi:hypothetical protein
MEIKTTYELQRGKWLDIFHCNVKWVRVKDIRKELCDRAESVRLASGNSRDYGYVDCLENLISYIDELSQSSPEDNRVVMSEKTEALQSGLDIPVCLVDGCGVPMVNAKDSHTGKISKYLWVTQCEHNKSLRLSKG